MESQVATPYDVVTLTSVQNIDLAAWEVVKEARVGMVEVLDPEPEQFRQIARGIMQGLGVPNPDRELTVQTVHGGRIFVTEAAFYRPLFLFVPR